MTCRETTLIKKYFLMPVGLADGVSLDKTRQEINADVTLKMYPRNLFDCCHDQ